MKTMSGFEFDEVGEFGIPVTGASSQK